MKQGTSSFEGFLAELDSRDVVAYEGQFRLAVQVIRLRKARKWTQQQLARASGIQQSEISRIESGQANPTWKTLLALAQSANMTLAFMPAQRRVRTRSPGSPGRAAPRRRAR